MSGVDCTAVAGEFGTAFGTWFHDRRAERVAIRSASRLYSGGAV